MDNDVLTQTFLSNTADDLARTRLKVAFDLLHRPAGQNREVAQVILDVDLISQHKAIVQRHWQSFCLLWKRGGGSHLVLGAFSAQLNHPLFTLRLLPR
jgi:hypothetical protein